MAKIRKSSGKQKSSGGTIFPGARLRRNLKKLTGMRVGRPAADTLALNIDSIVGEVLALAAKIKTHGGKRERISPRKVFLALNKDCELYHAVGQDAIIGGAGAVDKIHKALTFTKGEYRLNNFGQDKKRGKKHSTGSWALSSKGSKGSVRSSGKGKPRNPSKRAGSKKGSVASSKQSSQTLSTTEPTTTDYTPLIPTIFLHPPERRCFAHTAWPMFRTYSLIRK